MARPDQQPQFEPDEPNDQTQIQLSEPQNDQDDHMSQVELQSQSESQTTHQTIPISTLQVLAIVSLTVRLATWICLLVSLIVLASNTATIRGVYREVKIWFNDIYAYRYMMSAIVIGFAYTCLQVSLEIYQLSMRKRLMARKGLPKISFYGDKFLLSLLATGVGAAFGATYDLKKNLDELDDLLESRGDPLISQFRSKLDNFFNMAYVSAGFLLIAFLSSIASSIISSLALQNK
ncbi:hypothetical protein OSB04_017988 [Centaurea solstitialis]|uniref:CASP-like protein n=1 Tax=Centaurea solstitialis TaxID=347529 RepID=A0AA38TNX1_9ASTR|nr:hypothetical protein OSB04_017988 [Centaurea solstitialis]